MRFAIFRRLNTKVIDTVVGKIRSETPVYVNANKEVIYKKFTDLNNWYTRIIGLDEVKLYQDRVVNLQEKLLAAQEKRREIGRQLAEVRKKSNQLQDEIHKVNRQHNVDLFLNLMKEETHVLRQESEISGAFQECDQAERELFSAFTNAVRDSHEKQRAQLEYTKYFGIVLSIAGSFLAFFYSTIRKHDLKKLIEQKLSYDPKPLENDFKNFVKDEINKLSTQLITYTAQNNNSSQIVSQARNENLDEQSRRIIYYAGASVIVLVVLSKLMSS